jgi:hypothetical protein
MTIVRALDIGDAIVSLRPDAKIKVSGSGDDAVVTWIEDISNKPTDAEIRTELTRLKSEYDAKAYQRNRKPEYPDIGDQLDDLFKAGAFSTEMAAKIQAVKDKYPKDNT